MAHSSISRRPEAGGDRTAAIRSAICVNCRHGPRRPHGMFLGQAEGAILRTPGPNGGGVKSECDSGRRGIGWEGSSAEGGVGGPIGGGGDGMGWSPSQRAWRLIRDIGAKADAAPKADGAVHPPVLLMRNTVSVAVVTRFSGRRGHGRASGGTRAHERERENNQKALAHGIGHAGLPMSAARTVARPRTNQGRNRAPKPLPSPHPPR